jgi:hypothetical protein
MAYNGMRHDSWAAPKRIFPAVFENGQVIKNAVRRIGGMVRRSGTAHV